MGKLSSILILLLISGSLRSQSLQSLIPHVPTSPQAEAFKLFGEYAINYSTGAPDISIPLYEINHRGYNIPLNLKYNAQPLKPGYNYDVFGAGWGLSASSCVSRTIEYIPDEWRNFKLEQPRYDWVYSWCKPSCMTDYNYGHDKFNVTLPDGTAFDFYIENVNETITYKISDGRQVQISCSVGSDNIHSFTIVDENGVKYTFSGADTPYQGTYNSLAHVYVSWQLTQVDLPNSTEPIVFQHEILLQPAYGIVCSEPNTTIGHYMRPGRISYDPFGVDSYTAERGADPQPTFYKMRLLSSISYGSNRVLLTYDNPTGSEYNHVNRIRIFEGETVVKDINLGFTTRSITSACSTFQLAKLNSVTVRGSDPSAEAQRYECSYHFGNSTFGGTDHWGYLNSYNPDLPKFNLFTEWNMTGSGHAVNAGFTSAVKTSQEVNPYYKYRISYSPFETRVPAEAEAHGILSRLKLPTGGHTEFVFQNHEFLTATSADGDYIHETQQKVKAKAAGFRIRTIANYTSEGVVSSKKNYRYGKTYGEIYGSNHVSRYIHTGLGEPVADPNILTYLSFSRYLPWDVSIKNMILGLSQYGQREFYVNIFRTDDALESYDWSWRCTIAPSNFRRLVDGRSPVFYSDVTVYDGDVDEEDLVFPKGKTVYKYDLSDPNTGASFFEAPFYQGNVLNYERKAFLYNRLKSRVDYKFNSQSNEFTPIRKESNTWYKSYDSILDYSFLNLYPPDYYPTDIVVGALYTGKASHIGTSLLLGTSITEYDVDGDSITTSESFSYNNRSQLAEKSVSKSGAKVLKTTYNYPQINTSGQTPAIVQEMVVKNIIAPVINTTTSIGGVYDGFSEVAAAKTEYAKFGTLQAILPTKTYELEIKPTGSEYVLRQEVKSYSDNGNPLELEAHQAQHSAFIWGYNDRYMIAEAKNARQSEIFLDNFEEAAGWDAGLTAYDSSMKHSGRLSGKIDKPGAGERVSHSPKWLAVSLNSTKRFKYSGWVYSNGPSADIFLFMKRAGETGYYTYVDAVTTSATGEWRYVEKEFNVPADVTQLNLRIDNNGGGTVWFDDLRIHPSDAQMVTYTYDPLVGITSQTDPAGRTTYYEYDSLHRLKVLRDLKGKILKSFDYHYKP